MMIHGMVVPHISSVEIINELNVKVTAALFSKLVPSNNFKFNYQIWMNLDMVAPCATMVCHL